jgi:hypothetical protein
MISRITLWLFVIALGIDLGAGIYEARIVVPLWAGSVPESLADGNPYRRVAIDAGMRFWAYVTTAVAFFALLSLVFGFYTPAPQRAWRTFAAVAELAVVAMTLLYFRPTLIRLFMRRGDGLSPAAVTSNVRRWVMWSRVRIAVSFVAWCAALSALALS